MDDVIIYIPYTKDDIKNYNIVYQSDFLFDTNYLKKLLLFLLAFSPAIFLLASWYFYGKEKTYLDVPKELSSYPQERKAWEVAAYFHPPFSVIDKEFFSALLLDLYRRKLIDLKLKEKNVYVKINENPPKSINKKNINIFFIRTQAVKPRSFCNKRIIFGLRMIQQGFKSAQPKRALADILMPVPEWTEGVPAVIDMPYFQFFQSDFFIKFFK